MIRDFRQLIESSRQSFRPARDWQFGVQPGSSDTVHFQASFVAVITGNTMWYDDINQYLSLCFCSQSEPNEGDIFPRLYNWYAPWGGVAPMDKSWSEPSGGASQPMIRSRAMLAYNTHELTALDFSCFGGGCPRCDPRCRVAMNAVPDGTPVIMNVGTIAPIFAVVPGPQAEAGSGIETTASENVSPLHVFWFSHYMDPPSCVCDYDAHPEHCV